MQKAAAIKQFYQWSTSLSALEPEVYRSSRESTNLGVCSLRQTHVAIAKPHWDKSLIFRLDLSKIKNFMIVWSFTAYQQLRRIQQLHTLYVMAQKPDDSFSEWEFAYTNAINVLNIKDVQKKKIICNIFYVQYFLWFVSYTTSCRNRNYIVGLRFCFTLCSTLCIALRCWMIAGFSSRSQPLYH